MRINLDREKKIVLDGDVISHFIKGELINSLPTFYPGQLVILNIVKEEIIQRKNWLSIIEPLLIFGEIEEVEFPSDITYLREYAFLISAKGQSLGRGESACMVYCRYNKHVLASSNLKDIIRYCSFHKIEYVTTMDLILDCYQRNLLPFENCDSFIKKVIARGSRLPFKTFMEYLESIEDSD
jgi:hypothetical protein